MKLLLVVNPVSGDEDKTMLLNQLKDQLSPEDELDELRTNGKNDHERISKLLEGHSFDRILVAGGDGTVKTVAEAMIKNPQSLGLLPCGSANGLASDLDLPAQNEDFIKVALGNSTKKIDVLQFQDQLGLHISDLGMNAELIENFENSNYRGLLGYAIETLPTILQSKLPQKFEIEINGQKLERQAIMVAFANSKKFGTGAVVNPDGKMDDGYFELLIFKNLNLTEILKTWSSKAELSSDFVEIIKTKKALVSTQRPLAFQMDGEFCETRSKVEMEIKPDFLEIAVP